MDLHEPWAAEIPCVGSVSVRGGETRPKRLSGTRAFGRGLAGDDNTPHQNTTFWWESSVRRREFLFVDDRLSMDDSILSAVSAR